ncbi:hypothetical protein GN956_G4033 [Arapaima gigas]
MSNKCSICALGQKGQAASLGVGGPGVHSSRPLEVTLVSWVTERPSDGCLEKQSGALRFVLLEYNEVLVCRSVCVGQVSQGHLTEHIFSLLSWETL